MVAGKQPMRVGRGALYLTKFSMTPEAWAKLIKEPEDRREAVGHLLESAGASSMDTGTPLATTTAMPRRGARQHRDGERAGNRGRQRRVQLPVDTISPEGMPFWERTAQAINKIPADDDGSLLLTLLKPLGIEQGRPFEPDARQRKILEDAAEVGWLMNQTLAMAPRSEDATCYPGTQWKWAMGLDTSLRHAFWRDLDARIGYYFQGTMAAPANTEKAIGKGSQYLGSARDAEGEWLNGTCTYRLRVPANPPVELFWSVIVHDYQTRSHIQTDTNKAALTSYDQLKNNDDGSVDLYFGPNPLRAWKGIG